jgi:hypothetical protein
MRHENNGKCQRCHSIFEKYPGFHKGLREWFEALQLIHPEAHISCAGRGRDEQEAALIRGASKAPFGKSAHNFNAAIDIFEQVGDLANIYEINWFNSVIGVAIKKAPWLKWYGEKGSEFYELPHIELSDWKNLNLNPVESI